jgi:hypothetical protein
LPIVADVRDDEIKAMTLRARRYTKAPFAEGSTSLAMLE